MRKNQPAPPTDDIRLQALSQLMSRSVLAQYLGHSFNGNRDLYAALGYVADSELGYNHYYARYARQDIAQRLIDAPVSASWRDVPKLVDGEGDEDGVEATQFEEGWKKLVRNRKLNLFNAFQSVDKFAGLGQFAILVLGYEGDSDLSKPVTHRNGRKLVYVRAYGEGSVTLGTTVTNVADPRYGMPETYNIKTTSASNSSNPLNRIHWSRVVHVLDGLTESPVFGIPRLKCVFNRLMDLEKVAGGSAEMYWRGARPGMQFDLDPDSMMTPESKSALKEQMDEYENNLRRVLRTQGVKINPLAPQVSDPDKFIDTQLTLISGATGIPKRILTGSERGELASTQDAHNWNTIVHERRTDFCEPNILCPFVDRLVEHGVIPAPQAEFYTVEWPDLFAPSDKEQAEVAKLRSEALMMYTNSVTATAVIPPAAFVELIMGFDGSKLKKLLDAIKEYDGSEDEERIRELLETQKGATGGGQPGEEGATPPAEEDAE